MRDRPLRRRRGFSLIETLIVVGIMGILMMIGMPNLMAMFKRAKLTGAAQEAVAVLRKARYEAIRRSMNVCVSPRQEAGLASTTFGAFLDANGDCIFDPEDEPMTWAAFNLPDGVRFEGPAGMPDNNGFPVIGGFSRVRFSPNGTAGAAGAYRLGLVYQVGKAVTQRDYLEIRLPNVNSGKIEVRKYSAGQWYRQDERRWVWFIS
jgi:prepilin-type N-terminal cleavage/methylation domain-containing protein